MNDDDVVGTFALDLTAVWQKSANGHLLNVHPDHLKQGGAKKMLVEAFFYLAQKGFKKIELKTWHSNKLAVELFQSLGFKICGYESNKTMSFISYMPMLLSTIHAQESDEVQEQLKQGEFIATVDTINDIPRLKVDLGEAQLSHLIIQP